MMGETEEQNQTVNKPRRWILSPRAMLAFAGALVVIIALAVGLNVVGLREELLWRISPPRIDSLAVLPLENLSRDAGQDPFANLTTNLLTGNLQQMGTFRTIAPTSAARYRKTDMPLPEIARELNVAGIVQGGVLRSDDRVRISVNLIHASTNRRIWEQTFEGDLRDILNLQA